MREDLLYQSHEIDARCALLPRVTLSTGLDREEPEHRSGAGAVRAALGGAVRRLRRRDQEHLAPAALPAQARLRRAHPADQPRPRRDLRREGLPRPARRHRSRWTTPSSWCRRRPCRRRSRSAARRRCRWSRSSATASPRPARPGARSRTRCSTIARARAACGCSGPNCIGLLDLHSHLVLSVNAVLEHARDPGRARPRSSRRAAA